MARQRANQVSGGVIVADDHEVLRFGLVQLLKSELGATDVAQAGCFQDALDLLGDKSVELAIFDLGMPGLNSPRDLAAVRQRSPSTRVVVLSASHDRADILAALEAGVHGYLIKTVGTEQLIDRLAYVLSGEIYVPPILAESGPVSTAAKSGDRGERDDAVSAAGSPPHALSDRQRQVLEGLVMGHSNKQIARELQLAEGTVKMHIGALFRALGANNRAHAAALGRRLLD